MSFPVHGSCNSVVVSVRKVLLKSTILDSHLLSTSHIMADSDRPRSPVPARNRLEPPGQRQPLPCFPRWCGLMGSAVRTVHNMPSNSVETFMMGRMWSSNPPALPTSWAASQQFLPTPPNMPPPPTIPYSQGPSCPPTQPCSPTPPNSIAPLQPRSTSTPQSRPLSKPDKNEATRVYGFDLNEHWQTDRDHYANQKINGLTFPCTSHPFIVLHSEGRRRGM